MKRTSASIVVLFIAVAGLGYILYKARSASTDPVLEQVYVAASEVRGALTVGSSYADYLKRLQSLSSAILRANEGGARSESLKYYSDALDAYRDALELWHDKIEYPDSYGLGQYGTFQYSPRLEKMAKKYKVAAKVSVSDDVRDNRRAYEAVVREIWSQADKAVNTARGSK